MERLNQFNRFTEGANWRISPPAMTKVIKVEVTS
jgi:hypothetical protein